MLIAIIALPILCFSTKVMAYEVDPSQCDHNGKFIGDTYYYRETVVVRPTSTEWGAVKRVCSLCGTVMEESELHPVETYEVAMPDGSVETVTGWFDYEKAHEVHELINQYREENGLNSLKYNEKTQYASDIRAVESSVYFGHTRPDGTRWNTVTSDWTTGGENLASGQPTSEIVMDNWKKSPSHNKNLLYGIQEDQKNFEGISVSCFHKMDFADGDDTWPTDTCVWSQHFTFVALDEQSSETGAKGFVSRLYRVCLGREAEETGLNDWTNSLMSGEKKAVDVVQGVLCSQEYGNKGKSNGEVVNDCYQAMLGRDADEGGYADWTSQLDAGMSVNAIFAGFVGSEEFANLCTSYGIQPGTFELTEERDKNVGVTKFVSRLYTQALGRSYDAAGLNDWCGKINVNPSRENILNISTDGFFHSQEFSNIMAQYGL